MGCDSQFDGLYENKEFERAIYPHELRQPITIRVDVGTAYNNAYVNLILHPDGNVTWELIFDKASKHPIKVKAEEYPKNWEADR